MKYVRTIGSLHIHDKGFPEGLLNAFSKYYRDLYFSRLGCSIAVNSKNIISENPVGFRNSLLAFPQKITQKSYFFATSPNNRAKHSAAGCSFHPHQLLYGYGSRPAAGSLLNPGLFFMGNEKDRKRRGIFERWYSCATWHAGI